MSKAPATTEAGRMTSHKPDSDRMDPWFDDGNIVLSVQGKYFRVHRGILSTYSAVFKDMFDISSSKHPDGVHEEHERVDQCPVIPLYDEPADVQMVLRAMYDRRQASDAANIPRAIADQCDLHHRYPLPSDTDKVPLSIVPVFLRLGDKYDIPALIQDAKTRLRCAFDVTLSTAARISSHAGGSLQLFPGIAESDPHNFQVMNILREMGTGAPLLLAMYQCVVTCPTTTITDGYRLNGSACFLSAANLRSYIFVKGTLDHLRVRLDQKLRKSKAFACSRCALNISEYGSDSKMVIRSQPLVAWKREWSRLFCNTCMSDLKSQRYKVIEEAWNQIPAAFGFDTWEEVLEKQR